MYQFSKKTKVLDNFLEINYNRRLGAKEELRKKDTAEKQSTRHQKRTHSHD